MRECFTESYILNNSIIYVLWEGFGQIVVLADLLSLTRIHGKKKQYVHI